MYFAISPSENNSNGQSVVFGVGSGRAVVYGSTDDGIGILHLGGMAWEEDGLIILSGKQSNATGIVKMLAKVRLGDNNTPETVLDVNGTTTLRDWVYLNNGTHTGDSIGDRRFKTVNGVLVTQGCTVANSTRGSGTWVNVGVQLSDNTATASVYFEGCKRYRKDANNSYEETCMQSGANTYDWVVIKQNTWS